MPRRSIASQEKVSKHGHRSSTRRPRQAAPLHRPGVRLAVHPDGPERNGHLVARRNRPVAQSGPAAGIIGHAHPGGRRDGGIDHRQADGRSALWQAEPADAADRPARRVHRLLPDQGRAGRRGTFPAGDDRSHHAGREGRASVGRARPVAPADHAHRVPPASLSAVRRHWQDDYRHHRDDAAGGRAVGRGAVVAQAQAARVEAVGPRRAWWLVVALCLYAAPRRGESSWRPCWRPSRFRAGI